MAQSRLHSPELTTVIRSSKSKEMLNAQPQFISSKELQLSESIEFPEAHEAPKPSEATTINLIKTIEDLKAENKKLVTENIEQNELIVSSKKVIAAYQERERKSKNVEQYLRNVLEATDETAKKHLLKLANELEATKAKNLKLAKKLEIAEARIKALEEDKKLLNTRVTHLDLSNGEQSKALSQSLELLRIYAPLESPGSIGFFGSSHSSESITPRATGTLSDAPRNPSRNQSA